MRALAAADRQGIEKRLRRMFVRAVSCVDHRTANLLGQEFNSSGGTVANHDQIGAHGVECHGRIQQRLALLDGRGLDRHVHDIGAKPLSRKLEGALRAGGGFEEEIYLRAPPQHIAFLVDLLVLLDISVGEVEQVIDFEMGKALNTQQVLLGEDARSGRRHACH